MTTPTLTLPAGISVSVGSGRDETARVLKAQFGNGYAQRAGDGLNAITSEAQLTFENVTKAEGKVITDFLRERAGWQAFNWTPPDQTAPRMWTCEKWRTTHATEQFDTITVTFVQTFAP